MKGTVEPSALFFNFLWIYNNFKIKSEKDGFIYWKDQGKVIVYDKENLLVLISIRKLLGRGLAKKYNICSLFSTVCVCVLTHGPYNAFFSSFASAQISS